MTRLFTFLGCLLHIGVIFAQDNTNEQVKRLQRTIFVYNIAEQVEWPNDSQFETFTIGVLGPDRVAIDLQSMALKRTISQKPVQVVRFNRVKDVEGIQLLYVNQKFNYDIDYIRSSIAKQDILLISEDYKYNTSMINMVNVGNSFEYEINTSNIHANDFTFAPSLEQYAVSSAEKWKELFQKTQRDLEEETRQVEEQMEMISERDDQLQEQANSLNEKDQVITDSKKVLGKQRDSILNLVWENKLQLEKYEDKVIIEKALEGTIHNQIEYLKDQQIILDSINNLVDVQQEFLQKQDSEILEKQGILENQDKIIGDQKRVNILLMVVAGLLLLGAILIYRGYLSKRRLSNALAERNKEFEVQASLLKRKNEELEQFAYIASHDLQEPLSTINSLIGILKDDYEHLFDDVAKQSLQFMDDSSTRMRELIQALLKHSKLGLNQDITHVDTHELIGDIKNDLQQMIADYNAEIHEEGLPTVMASSVELRLVFQNLITNAIKFSREDESPVIQIAADKVQDGAFWEFSVSDNGIGIPGAYVDRIFAIFQRLHSRESYEGTGIGLAHVKKIIDSHGGEIWVESEVNKGSTFYFTLPA